VSEVYAKTRPHGADLVSDLSQSYTNSGIPGSIQQSRRFNVDLTDFLNGFKNPYWRYEIGKAQAATPASGRAYRIIELNPLLATAQYTSTSPPWYDTNRGVISGNAYNVDLGFPIVPPDVVTRVRNRCIAKFVDKANTAINSVESGQDIGDWRQTIHSALHPMQSLKEHVLGYFSKLKKAKRGRHTKTSLRKALSDTYLEWTFGWNPLAADIADGISAIMTRSSHISDNTPVEAHDSEIYDGSNGFASDLTYGPVTLRVLKKQTLRYTERLKGSVNVITQSGPISIQQSLGLLPENWIPTAWDLLPYSFILDYFLNVGDIIKAMCLLDSRVVWCVRTTRDLVTTDYTVVDKGPEFYPPSSFYMYQSRCSGGNSSWSVCDFTRSIVPPASLVPSLQFSLPTSIKPWENLGALMFAGSLPLVPFFKN